MLIDACRVLMQARVIQPFEQVWSSIMRNCSTYTCGSRGPGAAALTLCALSLMSSVAWAGDCPQGKTAVDAMKPGPSAPSGVTDTVISSIDIAPLGQGLAGYKMRMRKLVVEPGGVVPWHSHEQRPANIYIISGSITEYRSTCSEPIEHKAGDVTGEFGKLQHWWKNNSNEPAVLISADVLPPAMSPDESM